jgi:hypothetical protein
MNIAIALVVIGFIIFLLKTYIIDSPKIKGNVNSRGESIYHLPVDRLYKTININKKEGDRYFYTETEALEHGFRRSKVR